MHNIPPLIKQYVFRCLREFMTRGLAPELTETSNTPKNT